MDFTLSDEQTMLREGAGRYLAENYDFEARKALLARDGGFSESQWRQFADMGWLALPIPEEFDGLGGSFVDISLIQEAVGAHLVLEPIATTAILCAFLIAQGGIGKLRAVLLHEVAAGTQRIALAHGEQESRYALDQVTVRALPAADGYLLTGRKISVWDAPSAQHVIVSAVIDGEADFSLFLVAKNAAGISEQSYSLIDSTAASDLQFADSPAVLLIASNKALSVLEEAIDRMTLARVAETLGIMEKILDVTAEQLRNRSQFGQSLSKFQVLQHRMAEMFVEVQEVRSILYRGIALLGSVPEERSTAVSVAKVVATRASRIVGAEGIQLHGGVGMTDEYAVGHYFKRLLTLERQYGDLDHHARRIARTYRTHS